MFDIESALFVFGMSLTFTLTYVIHQGVVKILIAWFLILDLVLNDSCTFKKDLATLSWSSGGINLLS